MPGNKRVGSVVLMEKIPFDFQEHRRATADEYARIRPLYEGFANTIKSILQEALERKSIKVNSIDARAKSLESLGQKATIPAEDNPDAPKYRRPLKEITDLAGVRVITFFPRTVTEVGQLIEDEFEIVERVDHSAARLQAEQFGYQSVHYIIRLATGRTRLPEYEKYRGLTAEVQVRTVLQHAWAEIEHDIQYKSSLTIPTAIRRRFMALAGLLEIADREFEIVQEDETLLRQEARKAIEEDQFEKVEITPDALRAYLDKRMGSDNRTSQFSYEWTAKFLREIGFVDFKQVEDCIKNYNDDQISRIVFGSRQGQITRFETTLLASMGLGFLKNHPLRDEPWFQKSVEDKLKKLQDRGINIGSFTPLAEK